MKYLVCITTTLNHQKKPIHIVLALPYSNITLINKKYTSTGTCHFYFPIIT